ncbi:DUF4258 domain-containing protein [bacterium]|nr:DUF4258 domain-containing protein [bacterium]
MKIKKIIAQIQRGKYRFSDHAVKRMIERNITRIEIEQSIYNGTIIEEYPEDKYSPSCLIYGKTEQERDLHVQLSVPPTIVIITTYEPNPNEWIDYIIRKK